MDSEQWTANINKISVYKRMAMKYQQLENTQISAMGLGAMPLSLSNRPPEADAISVIHKALDLGVTLIDTSDAYCRDESDKHHNERE